MSKFRFFALVCIITIQTSYAESIQPPSQEIVYDKSSADELYNKSWSLMVDNLDSSIYYADLLKKVAQKIGYKTGLVKAYYVKGNAYISAKYYDKAVNELYTALYLAKSSSDNEILKKKVSILHALGNSYELTSNYEMAIDFYTEGLTLAERINYEKEVADLNYNIGGYHLEKKEWDIALKYYNIALDIYMQKNYYDCVPTTYNIIGILFYEKEKYELAKEYYQKALSFAEEHSTSELKKSWFISNIGETYFVLDQYDSAKYYYSQALALSEKLNDTEKIKWLNNNLGDVYLKQNNYAVAIAYYQRSIALDNGDDRIDEEMKRAYKQLAVAYENTGKYKEALAYTHSFMGQVALLEETKDKLMVQNAQYRMKEVEWQRQLADKETLLAKLTSWLNGGLVIFGIFLIVFGYISRRLYLHYTVHKEMKRILMTPISSELERRERENYSPDDENDL